MSHSALMNFAGASGLAVALVIGAAPSAQERSPPVRAVPPYDQHDDQPLSDHRELADPATGDGVGRGHRHHPGRHRGHVDDVPVRAAHQLHQRFRRDHEELWRGMIVQAHGFCMDNDGNLWAGDSGPFGDDASTAGRGFQLHKFSQDGELLISLGQAGVSAAGEDTFIGPTSCALAPNGNIIVADGHWPRPSTAQQDGDRLVEITTDGEFVRAVGKLGLGPGEFMGPHALAFDSQGRLFVADRSNNRVQILDQDLNFVDEWRHFGRPSGITILTDDTLIVADSESGSPIPGPPAAPEGGGRSPRNPVGRSGFGSAARRTALCAISFRAPVRKAWRPMSGGTSLPA